MLSHPWLRSYPAGMDWTAPVVASTVQQILDDAIARWSDRPAVDFMGRKISYGELGRLVARAAKGLQNLGVGPGVHVGLYLPNSPHAIIGLFAILKAGGTVVNYSPLDAEKVLEHKVDDSETDFIITLNVPALYPQMDRLLGKTRLKGLIVGEIAEMAGQRSVLEDLVSVIHSGRPGQGQRRARPRLHRNPDAVPGVTPVAGVSLGRPAGDVTGEPAVGIEVSVLRRQVYRLPLRVVKVRLGPQRLACLRVNGRVAHRKLPRPVERHRRLAEGDVRDAV